MSGFNHLVADFLGVTPLQLRDNTLLHGLLIAAAGAAGFSTVQAPLIKKRPNDGLAAFLLLDGCHIAVHTFPERELMLLDILSLATHDARKALDVFARRVEAKEIRSETRVRG